MKFKESIFNLKFRDLDNNLLILNTYSKKLIKISQDNEAKVNNLLNNINTIDNINEQILNKLISYGVIINSDMDEMSIVEDEINNSIFGDEYLNLTIVPTDSCNFDCKYCYQRFQKNFMSSYTEDKVLKFISENIGKHKYLNLNWFGGEPLICKDRIITMSKEIKKICKLNKVNFLASITTNGYELDLETFKNLIKNNVLFYQITLDGLSMTHDKYRRLKNGYGSFDRIINNLRSIRDNINLKIFKIVIRVNLTKEINEYREEFLKFYKEEFGKDDRFCLYLERVKDWGGEKVKGIQNELIDKEDTIIYDWMKRATEYSIQLPRFYEYHRYQSICDGNKKNGFIINYDGSLNKCTLAIYDNALKNLNNVGNIFNGICKDKESIWVFKDGDRYTCNNCSLMPFCGMTGCKYKIMKDSINFCKKDETIEIFRLQAINASKLNSCINL